MYTKEEFEFIDDLLQRALNNDFTYSKLAYDRNFNFDLYNKLFTDINKDPYKLLELYEDSFVITTLGREISSIGFEQHLSNLEKDSEIDIKIKHLTLDDLKKTNVRSNIALILSGVAIVITIIFGVLSLLKDDTKIDKTDKNLNGDSNNTENNSTTAAEINHTQTPSDFIDTTLVEIISDTSINSNHNSNILNDSLPNH